MDNNVVPINFFDKFHNQIWKIKGNISVVDFSGTTNLENGDISKSVGVQMEDYSGKISIAAFDTHTVLLNRLATVDTE